MALMKRAGSGLSASTRLDGSGFPSEDLVRYPSLCEFLSSSQWADGSPRALGTLLVFLDQNRIKACLSDRDQGLVAFAVAGSISELLLTCDRLVSDPSTDWRAQKKSPARGR